MHQRAKYKCSEKGKKKVSQKIVMINMIFQQRILECGNKRKEWYIEILDILTKPEYDCCYFMLWSNYSREGSYYTPFIAEKNQNGTYHGHEMLDYFIEMYNSSKSVFASDQSAIIRDVNAGKIVVPQVLGYEELSGYITAPISNKFISEKTELKARVNKKVTEAEFRVVGKEEEVVIPAKVKNRQVTAILTKENIKKMKETANGKIELYADGKKLASINVLLNVDIPEMEIDTVDNFENYFGLDTLLNGSWAINKDSGCELNLSNTKEK